MEIDNSFVFQINDKLINESYNLSQNFQVIYDECESRKKNLCAIYFSSNEIYYPNTQKSFNESILVKDKYEWKSNRISGAFMHIFVRDIQKQWYIEGINSLVNTPDLLAEKLRELTSGFEVYTVGSSAGGFAAILFGSLLKAKRVYAFNAQLDLHSVIHNSSAKIDPILYKYRSDIYRSYYFNVSPFLNQKTEYFYFQSANSFQDIAQYNTCKAKDLLIKIEFSTSNHGFPFMRHDLKYILKLSATELKKLSNKRIHPFLFSVHVHGPIKATMFTFNALKKRLEKKIKERLNS